MFPFDLGLYVWWRWYQLDAVPVPKLFQLVRDELRSSIREECHPVVENWGRHFCQDIKWSRGSQWIILLSCTCHLSWLGLCGLFKLLTNSIFQVLSKLKFLIAITRSWILINLPWDMQGNFQSIIISADLLTKNTRFNRFSCIFLVLSKFSTQKVLCHRNLEWNVSLESYWSDLEAPPLVCRRWLPCWLERSHAEKQNCSCCRRIWNLQLQKKIKNLLQLNAKKSLTTDPLCEKHLIHFVWIRISSYRKFAPAGNRTLSGGNSKNPDFS